jgi:flagellar basal body-associated protein FliL
MSAPQQPPHVAHHTPAPPGHPRFERTAGEVPPRRRGRAPFVVLAVTIAVLLVAGTGLTVWLLTRPAGNTATVAPPPSPSAATRSVAPAPTEAVLDERATCVTLLPLLDRAADIALAAARKQPVDKAQAQKTLDDLTTVYRVAPASMKDDIGSLMTTMSSVVNGLAVDGQYAAKAGLNLATTCRKYAN